MQHDGQSSGLELRIQGVSKTYSNGVQALKDVSLTIMSPRMYRPHPARVASGADRGVTSGIG